ncbi:hypothetical protein, partial [Prescottella equi]|uniref:hypothetical protein n=1 Tax=Rhodococcus hoagii TaxID=43767 RepID=UPI00158498DC
MSVKGDAALRLAWVLDGHRAGSSFIRSLDATDEARAAIARIGAGTAEFERFRPVEVRAIERAGRWTYTPAGMVLGFAALLLTGKQFGSLVGEGALGAVHASAVSPRRRWLQGLLHRESRTVALLASVHATDRAASIVEPEPPAGPGSTSWPMPSPWSLPQTPASTTSPRSLTGCTGSPAPPLCCIACSIRSFTPANDVRNTVDASAQRQLGNHSCCCHISGVIGTAVRIGHSHTKFAI